MSFREAVELLGRYQGQISGFLMAVVSQLCFAGKEPPEPATIRHIFGYIIHRSVMSGAKRGQGSLIHPFSPVLPTLSPLLDLVKYVYPFTSLSTRFGHKCTYNPCFLMHDVLCLQCRALSNWGRTGVPVMKEQFLGPAQMFLQCRWPFVRHWEEYFG